MKNKTYRELIIYTTFGYTSDVLPSSFESQELWAGSVRKRVGLWIHLGLLTDRQHADNISFPNERELLKILTVLSMENTEAEKSFPVFGESILGFATQWPSNDSQIWPSSPCMQKQLPSIEVWFVRNLWCYTLDEWQRLHFWPTRLVRYFY